MEKIHCQMEIKIYHGLFDEIQPGCKMANALKRLMSHYTPFLMEYLLSVNSSGLLIIFLKTFHIPLTPFPWLKVNTVVKMLPNTLPKCRYVENRVVMNTATFNVMYWRIICARQQPTKTIAAWYHAPKLFPGIVKTV